MPHLPFAVFHYFRAYRGTTNQGMPAVVLTPWDKVAKTPDLVGRYGRAWRADLAEGRRRHNVNPELDAALVLWVIEAPWARPAWHSYALMLAHLRPTPHLHPPKIHLDGATHELWLYAL